MVVAHVTAIVYVGHPVVYKEALSCHAHSTMFRRRRMRMRKRVPFRRHNIRRRTRFSHKRFRSRKRLDVHHFKSCFQSAVLNQVAGAATAFDISVAPASIPEFAAISGVFNQIRLNKIVVKFLPNGNISDVSTLSATGGSIGQVHTAINHISSSAPSGLGSIISYPTHRVHAFWRTFSRAFVPSFREDGGGIANATPKFKVWVRTDVATVDALVWTGLQIVFDAGVTGLLGSYTPYITVFYSCKEKN